MNKKNFKIILFAHDYVGHEILKFMLEYYSNHLARVVVIDEDSKSYKLLEEYKYPLSKVIFENEIYDEKFIRYITSKKINYCILAWWPNIIKEPLLSAPKVGIINFHPSYLPYNRGKDPNFWSIVEETPFGVSLQLIDKSIDGGDIIFRKKIEKRWEDTGRTLYLKAREEIISLFINNYEKIIDNKYDRIKQYEYNHKVHYRKELEPTSKIDLDGKYTARQLLNLLRARTFPPHPGCYFFDNGKKFEVTIDIKEINNGSN